MYTWKNVTESFSESKRHYKDCYLEIDEVYDERVEVSLFSAQKGLYEIYVSYGCMYVVIYAEAEEAEAKRKEIQTVYIRYLTCFISNIHRLGLHFLKSIPRFLPMIRKTLCMERFRICFMSVGI